MVKDSSLILNNSTSREMLSPPLYCYIVIKYLEIWSQWSSLVLYYNIFGGKGQCEVTNMQNMVIIHIGLTYLSFVLGFLLIFVYYNIYI